MQNQKTGHPGPLYGDRNETRSLFATWLHGLGVDRTSKKGRLLALNVPIRRAQPVYLRAPGSATGRKRNLSASFCTWQWPSELRLIPALPSPLEPAPGYLQPVWNARAPRLARSRWGGATERTALRDPSAPWRTKRAVSPAQNTDRVSSRSPRSRIRPCSPVPHHPQRKALACASRALGPCARGSALGARDVPPASHSKVSRTRNLSLRRIKGHQG